VWGILGAILLASLALLVSNNFNPPADQVLIQSPFATIADHTTPMETQSLSITSGKLELDPVTMTSMTYSTCTTSYGVEDDPRLRLFEEL
jgi:hypothetical protein